MERPSGVINPLTPHLKKWDISLKHLNFTVQKGKSCIGCGGEGGESVQANDSKKIDPFRNDCEVVNALSFITRTGHFKLKLTLAFMLLVVLLLYLIGEHC